MSYILDGAGVDSPECRQLQIQSVDNVERESGVPATLLFDAVDAFIEYDGPENHYKPYLSILGRPAGIQADLPYNISTLRYQSSHDKRLMTYRYDFSRENLAHMVADGLFEPGFQPSQVARTSQYELPCEISYVAFPPDEKAFQSEDDAIAPPVIFASLQPGSLHCDDESSGYTIHEYFDPAPVYERDVELEAEKYELPEKARVLGSEFSFAASLEAPQAAQNGPEFDDAFEAATDIPSAAERPGTPVSAPVEQNFDSFDESDFVGDTGITIPVPDSFDESDFAGDTGITIPVPGPNLAAAMTVESEKVARRKRQQHEHSMAGLEMEEQNFDSFEQTFT